MYIPDPIEQMEARQDGLYYQCLDDDGSWICPSCKKPCDIDNLIPLSAAPDSPAVCYECLPKATREMYDKITDTLNQKYQESKGIK